MKQLKGRAAELLKEVMKPRRNLQPVKVIRGRKKWWCIPIWKIRRYLMGKVAAILDKEQGNHSLEVG